MKTGRFGRTWLTISTTLLAALSQGAEAPSAARLMPADAVLALEIKEPRALLGPLLSPEMSDAIKSLPAWQQRNVGPRAEGLERLAGFIEMQYGTNWQTVLQKLTGGGLAFALGPAGDALLSVEAEDEPMLNQFHAGARMIAARTARQNPARQPREWQYQGVTVSSFGPKEAHAVVGNRLLLANRPKALEQALDQRANAGAKGLVSSPEYVAARKAVGEDATAIAFVKLEAIRKRPQVQKALEKGGGPLATLLLGGTGGSLNKATWLAVGLHVKDDLLTIKIASDTPAGTRDFAIPQKAGEGLLPALSVPGGIASASLYRDLERFYAAKEELFPERTSGLVFFENMMGIFFSGMHLTEGVLAEIRPDIRLVVARQQYDAAIGRPAVEVPAFAVVMRLRNPEKFGEVVEEAWQKAVGMSSFTRGQKAQPGFIIDRIPYDDTRITVARFRQTPDQDQNALDIRFNFRPSLARPGDYAILSSSDDLARQLVAAVKKESANPGRPLSGMHSLVELDGKALLAAVEAGREELILNSMIKKGKTREQAEEAMAGLVALLQCVKDASLSGGQEDSHPQVKLQLKLKYPDAGQIAAARARFSTR